MAHRMPYNLRPSESTSNLHEAVAGCGTPAGRQVIFLKYRERRSGEKSADAGYTRPCGKIRFSLEPGLVRRPPTRVCGATMPNAVVNLAARSHLIPALL